MFGLSYSVFVIWDALLTSAKWLPTWFLSALCMFSSALGIVSHFHRFVSSPTFIVSGRTPLFFKKKQYVKTKGRCAPRGLWNSNRNNKTATGTITLSGRNMRGVRPTWPIHHFLGGSQKTKICYFLSKSGAGVFPVILLFGHFLAGVG